MIITGANWLLLFISTSSLFRIIIAKTPVILSNCEILASMLSSEIATFHHNVCKLSDEFPLNLQELQIIATDRINTK